MGWYIEDQETPRAACLGTDLVWTSKNLVRGQLFASPSDAVKGVRSWLNAWLPSYPEDAFNTAFRCVEISDERAGWFVRDLSPRAAYTHFGREGWTNFPRADLGFGTEAEAEAVKARAEEFFDDLEVECRVRIT
jgi:hypothetical protein